MNAMERLLVKDACIELMTAYCTHLDARHEDEFVALFTPDATIARLAEPSYESAGHDGIRRVFSARPASILSYHMMLNHAVTVAGETTASARALGIVVRGNRDRDAWPKPIRGLELLVEYLVDFRLEAGGWRIHRCAIRRLLDVEVTQ
ncbi:MAG: nuclear transport factor 2 family protein [Pseudomonadota bacterium]